jgi:hypothetical protein
MMDTAHHELSAAFVAHGLPLHATLQEMLAEHHSHRTERRGCGYTQATRFLADLINRPRLPRTPGLGLFDTGSTAAETADADDGLDAGDWPRRFAARRAAIAAALRLPESRLLFALVADLLDPPRPGHSDFPVAEHKLKVGSCPLAEQYFLEIAHDRVRRGGRIMVVVDAAGAPLALEKRGLGDEHSAITLAPLTLHGVRLPPASLLALDYDDATVLPHAPALHGVPGHRLSLDQVLQGRFLRLTTLAVAPTDRPRAFSAHFRQQVDGRLFSPDTTTIEQLQAVAIRALTA